MPDNDNQQEFAAILLQCEKGLVHDKASQLLTIKLKPTRQIIRQAWQEITDTVAQTVDKPVYAQ